MKHLPHITESEWAVISTLWGESPLTAAEIVERVNVDKNLAVTTIKTLLRRLISKKAVGYTVDRDNKKLYYYYPLVEEQDCVVEESKQFLSLYFQNNVKKLFATFVDNSDLSEEEVDSLREMLERKKEDMNE